MGSFTPRVVPEGASGSGWGRQRQTSMGRAQPRWRGLLWAESPAHISPGLRLGETLGSIAKRPPGLKGRRMSIGPRAMRCPFRAGTWWDGGFPEFRQASTLG